MCIFGFLSSILIKNIVKKFTNLEVIARGSFRPERETTKIFKHFLRRWENITNLIILIRNKYVIYKELNFSMYI